MMSEGLRDRAAIVGVGETEYSKASGRTELALACEAIGKAAADAGISIDEIDGLVRYDMDPVDEVALTSSAGLRNLRWMSQTGYGGTGGNAVIVHAAAAIAAGVGRGGATRRRSRQSSSSFSSKGSSIVMVSALIVVVNVVIDEERRRGKVQRRRWEVIFK